VQRLCNSFLGTGNRLHTLVIDCQRGNSLKKTFLSMRSRYGTHCMVTCIVRFLVKESILFLMQSYPARALDRKLQGDWARDAREGPRVLMSLRVDFGPMG